MFYWRAVLDCSLGSESCRRREAVLIGRQRIQTGNCTRTDVDELCPKTCHAIRADTRFYDTCATMLPCGPDLRKQLNSNRVSSSSFLNIWISISGFESLGGSQDFRRFRQSNPRKRSSSAHPIDGAISRTCD